MIETVRGILAQLKEESTARLQLEPDTVEYATKTVLIERLLDRYLDATGRGEPQGVSQ
jgi:hypothetical protein